MRPHLILGSLLISATMLFSTVPSYSDNPGGIALPDQCPPLDEGTEFVHTFDAAKFPVGPDPDESVFPGDDVIAIANFNNPLNPQFQTEFLDQIRFLWFDGSGTLQQETVVPVDPDVQTLAQDKFIGVFGPNTTWDVIACYEGTNLDGTIRTVGLNTIHLDIDSFFVLPESSIGAFALIVSSLATLGAFVFLWNLQRKDQTLS